MKYIDNDYFESVRAETFDRVQPATLALVIDEAQAQVDLYIGRYLPLSEVPPSLKAIMVDIVDYRLSEYEATDITKDRYRGAMDSLDRIEKAGFPEFYDENADEGSERVFGNNYISGIDRSGW